MLVFWCLVNCALFKLQLIGCWTKYWLVELVLLLYLFGCV